MQVGVRRRGRPWQGADGTRPHGRRCRSIASGPWSRLVGRRGHRSRSAEDHAVSVVQRSKGTHARPTRRRIKLSRCVASVEVSGQLRVCVKALLGDKGIAR
jgi:hypothetical protein